MLYIVRRKEDDKYLTYDYESYALSWQYDIDENCYFDKEKIELIKTELGEAVSDVLIYSIINPTNENN